MRTFNAGGLAGSLFLIFAVLAASGCRSFSSGSGDGDDRSDGGRIPSCLAGALYARGMVVWKQGRLNQAEELMRKTVEIEREHLGDKRQFTVTSMCHLAAVLTEWDRLD